MELKWKEAGVVNKINQYETFLAKYPESEYYGKAEQKLDTLRNTFTGVISKCIYAMIGSNKLSFSASGRMIFPTVNMVLLLQEYPEDIFLVSLPNVRKWELGSVTRYAAKTIIRPPVTDKKVRSSISSRDVGNNGCECTGWKVKIYAQKEENSYIKKVKFLKKL